MEDEVQVGVSIICAQARVDLEHCLRLCSSTSPRHRIGCIGAGIIILAHGFEAFSQQMVTFGQEPQEVVNTTFSPAPPPPRSEIWDTYLSRGYTGGEFLCSRGDLPCTNPNPEHTDVRLRPCVVNQGGSLFRDHIQRDTHDLGFV